MSQNPFTPGFGHSPAILAGRSAALAEFDATLRGDLPEQRAILISGARGIGKTVLLSEFEARAREAGWAVITLHTGSVSLLGELRAEVVSLLRARDPHAETSQLTGAGVSGFSATRATRDRYTAEPESTAGLMERLAALIERPQAGLLIVLDELQSIDRAQLYELSQHMQDLMRRHAHVVFVAAGLRAGVEALLSHDRTTFLRRAHRLDLHMVDIGTAAEAIRMTVADTDMTITPEAAVAAGEVSQGYPYLIQLIGSKAWRSAQGSGSIQIEDVRASRVATIADMIRNVHGPALRGLSPRKLDYLRAMLPDADATRVSDIAARLGTDPRYQSTYRTRLIADDLIEPAGRGFVRFALPYLREAIEEVDAAPSPTRTDTGLDRTRTRPPATRF